VRADVFADYHPGVNLGYFALVIIFAMFFLNPVCLLLAASAALSYALFLEGRRLLRFAFLLVPLLLLTLLLSPLFNHQGATILTYFPNGNPLTLESILYSAAAGSMLLAVILWFVSFNTVMTTDKFVYLFGRVIPALSLILSLTLRLVPRFQAQIKVITEAQRCLGRAPEQGNLGWKMRSGVRILSIMVTWALENAIATADSMKSRGYGLRGRTAFALFRWTRRDCYALVFLLVCGLYILAGAGGLSFRYYPSLQNIPSSLYSMSLYLVYATLCYFPLVINIHSAYAWRQKT
jgi:energy-coupling factor transport system permease protein